VLPKNIAFFFQSQVLLANNQVLAAAALPSKKVFIFCEIFLKLFLPSRKPARHL